MNPRSPQTMLEAALITGDEPALRAALAAGADPNALNAKGQSPLEQALSSPWPHKILDRLIREPRNAPQMGTPDYPAMARRRLAVAKQAAAKLHHQRHHLMHVLLDAGAAIDPPHREPGSLPLRVLWDEVGAYLDIHGQVPPPPEKSLARLMPWILRVQEWPASGTYEDAWSVLDDLEFNITNQNMEPQQPHYDDAVETFLGQFTIAVTAHNPVMAERWQRQLRDDQDAGLPHLFQAVPLSILIEQGLGQRLAAERQAQLNERPAPASRPRRRA